MEAVPLRGEAEEFDVINPSIWQGKDPPRREWVVEDLFLKGTVAMISGDGGVGKSLILQQLLSSAAIGRDWLGLDVKPGPGLGIFCEDDGDELWRRQDRINGDLCCSMTEVGEGGLMLKPRVGQCNDLVYLDRAKWIVRPTPLFDRLWDFCKYEGIKIVGIDTATQTFNANQNDERMVTGFISLLRGLAIRIQGLIVLTKHPSLSGRATGTGESGNVAWNNSVRSRAYLHKDKDSKQLKLQTMKSNYGASGLEIPLRWADGVFVRDGNDNYRERWFG